LARSTLFNAVGDALPSTDPPLHLRRAERRDPLAPEIRPCRDSPNGVRAERIAARWLQCHQEADSLASVNLRKRNRGQEPEAHCGTEVLQER